MKFKDKSHRLARRVLALLNKQGHTEDIVVHIVRLIHAELGIECVGIRLNDGQDYPYFFTRGFSNEFVEKENHLCAKNESGEIILDDSGNPLLECMCGNVIRGKTDPSLPFFTPYGSFWTNSTTELLSSTSEKERQARTRNQCNKFGYESVALIPIRRGRTTLGLLQLNDSREERFTLEMIEFLEGLGGSVSLLISLKSKFEEIAHQKSVIEQTVKDTVDELDSILKTIQTRSPDMIDADENTVQRLDSVLKELRTLKIFFDSPPE